MALQLADSRRRLFDLYGQRSKDGSIASYAASRPGTELDSIHFRGYRTRALHGFGMRLYCLPVRSVVPGASSSPGHSLPATGYGRCDGSHRSPNHPLPDGQAVRRAFQSSHHTDIFSTSQNFTWDAMFYVLFQFMGGMLGVGVAAICFCSTLAKPTVEYAVTVPGIYGTAAAFFAELFMAALLMAVVLWMTNRPALANYTSYCVGVLIAFYVLFFAPVSGFSINPARTVGSAVLAGHMDRSAGCTSRRRCLGCLSSCGGLPSALTAPIESYAPKLHPDHRYPCPFLCEFPGHRHAVEHVTKV